MHAGAALPAGMGVGHAIAQALGGRYGLSHRAMNALSLPPAPRFNRGVAAGEIERFGEDARHRAPPAPGHVGAVPAAYAPAPAPPPQPFRRPESRPAPGAPRRPGKAPPATATSTPRPRTHARPTDQLTVITTLTVADEPGAITSPRSVSFRPQFIAIQRVAQHSGDEAQLTLVAGARSCACRSASGMSCGRSSTPIWTSFMAPLRAWGINKASGARQEQLERPAQWGLHPISCRSTLAPSARRTRAARRIGSAAWCSGGWGLVPIACAAPGRQSWVELNDLED